MKNEEQKIDNIQGNGVLPCVSTSSTNSKLGSYHWFHTILANHKDIGEFLSEKTPNEDILREWGKKLYETSKELIDGYESINRI
jgi:hypothetical protein